MSELKNTYQLYLINNSIFLNYEYDSFDTLTFDSKPNLIRIGYDSTTENSDLYLIEINKKIRQSSLKSYPNITIYMNIHKNDKFDKFYQKYPFYSRNTSLLDKKNKYIEKTNIFPKYFELKSEMTYIIDTKIKLNCDICVISDSIKAEIYAFVFHLRMKMINECNLEFDDYFDEDDKIVSIEYNFGESLYHNGYYRPTKRWIQLYNETTGKNYDNKQIDDNDDNENEDYDNKSDISDVESEEYLPDIIKLNINLTNKILELENKINTLTTNTKNDINNLEYKINKNITNISKCKTYIQIYFIFFIMISIFMYFLL
jgi:hypothetical protein